MAHSGIFFPGSFSQLSLPFPQKMPPLGVLRRQRRDLNKSHEAKLRRFMITLDRNKRKFVEDNETYESKIEALNNAIKVHERSLVEVARKKVQDFEAEMDALKAKALAAGSPGHSQPQAGSLPSQSSSDSQ